MRFRPLPVIFIGVLFCLLTGGVSLWATPSFLELLPQEKQQNEGQGFVLSIKAKGEGRLSYRWRHNGQVISSAVGPAVRKAQAALDDAGVYEVEVTDVTKVSVKSRVVMTVFPSKTHLIAWGDNSAGQCDVPVSIFTSSLAVFSAGAAHSVAVKQGFGTPVAWGDNTRGQTDIPSIYLIGKKTFAVSAGDYHTVALRDDLTVFAWGDDSAGQCDVPSGLADVMAVAAGSAHSLALRLDGTIIAWGDNQFGQLDVPSLRLPAIAIAAGQDHSLALLQDGTVVAWGANDFGQSTVPPALKNVVSIGIAGDCCFAITNRGQVVVWGDGSFAQTSVPAKTGPFSNVVGGWDFLIGLRKNNPAMLSSWGNGAALVGQPAAATRIRKIAAGRAHVLALRNSQQDKPPKITSLQPSLTVQDIDWDKPFELTVQATGTFLRYQWYRDGVAISGATGPTYRVTGMRLVDEANYSVKVSNAAGAITSWSARVNLKRPPLVFTKRPAQRTVVKTGQTLRLDVGASGAGNLSYIWRKNGRIIYYVNGPVLAQTVNGIGDEGHYTVSVKDEAAQTIHEVAFVVVERPGATQVVAWGENAFGQTNVPLGLTDVVAIAAGDNHSLALRLDGTVVAWGDNQYGQAAVPPGIKDAVAITAYGNQSYALLADGRVWRWGQYGLPFVGYLAYDYPSEVGIKALAIVPGSQATGWLLNNNGLETICYAIAARSWYRVNAEGILYRYDYYGGIPPSWNYNPYNLNNHLVSVSGISPNVAALSDSGVGYAWSACDETFPNDHGKYKLDATSLIVAAPGSWAVKRTNGAVAVLKFYGAAPAMGNIPVGLDHVEAISGGIGHMLALRDASTDPVLAITRQPQGRQVMSGAGVVLDVKVSGGGGVRYQWRKDGVAINGAESPRLVLVSFSKADEGAYTVKIHDGQSEVTSDAAVLAMGSGLSITTKPARRLGLHEGENLDLAVDATGDAPLSYEWRHNGRRLTGQTSAALHLDNVTYRNAGRYSVRVTDAHGAQVVAYSHVFVLPRLGTEVLALKEGASLFIPPADMHDAIKVAICIGDTSPFYAMALMLDGTVRVWGAQMTPTITADAAVLSDIVDITPNAVLRADGAVLPLPGRTTVRRFLRDRSDVVDMDESGSVALLEDGRVIMGTDGSHTDSVYSVPNVDEPVGIGWVSVRYPVDFAIYAVAVSEDGNFASSASNSEFSWPVLSSVRKLVKFDTTLFAVDDQNNWIPSCAYGAPNVTAPQAWMGAGVLRTDVRAPGWSEADAVLTISSTGASRFWHRSNTDAAWQDTLPVDTKWKHGALDGAVSWDDALLLRDPQQDPGVGFSSHRLVVGLDETATLSPDVTGPEPMTYRWEHNGRVVPGATSRQLNLAAGDSQRAGWYRVTVTSPFGVVTDDICYVLNEIPRAKIIGWDSTGPKESPAIDNVVSIANGIALLADGTLAGWQTQSEYPDLLPSGLKDVVAVSSFDINWNRFGVALSADGTLVVWNRKTGLVVVTYANVLSVRGAVAILRSGVAKALDGDPVLSAAKNQHLVDVWRFNAIVVGLRDDGSVVGSWNVNAVPTAFLGGNLRDVSYNSLYMFLLLEDGIEHKVTLVKKNASPVMWDWEARTTTQTTQIAYDPNRGNVLSLTNDHQLLSLFQNDQNVPQKTGIYQLDYPWALCSSPDVMP